MSLKSAHRILATLDEMKPEVTGVETCTSVECICFIKSGLCNIICLLCLDIVTRHLNAGIMEPKEIFRCLVMTG
jgi:hypothetical protein